MNFFFLQTTQNKVYDIPLKSIFMSMNSRSLPQNKALFGLIYGKVCHLCTKIRADDPGTFVANGGYHFNEEVKRNLLTPKTVVKKMTEGR